MMDSKGTEPGFEPEGCMEDAMPLGAGKDGSGEDAFCAVSTTPGAFFCCAINVPNRGEAKPGILMLGFLDRCPLLASVADVKVRFEVGVASLSTGTCKIWDF